MHTILRNFFQPPALYQHNIFALRSRRSLLGLTEIPRRFSSSSLPPLFVSGRFAGFSSSVRRQAGI